MCKKVGTLILTILAVSAWLTTSSLAGVGEAVILECKNGFVDVLGTQRMSTIPLSTDTEIGPCSSPEQTCDKCMMFLRNMKFNLVQISAMSLGEDGIVNMLFTMPRRR